MFEQGHPVEIRGKRGTVVRSVGGGDYLVKMDDEEKPVAVNMRLMTDLRAQGGPDARPGVVTKSAAPEPPKAKSPTEAATEASKTSPATPPADPKGETKKTEPSKAPAKAKKPAPKKPKS